MKQRNVQKWKNIILKGKKNYIIKYGVLGWGFSTGLIVRIWEYIDEKQGDLVLFLTESIPHLVIFMLMGIPFGLFNFHYIKNKVSDNNPDQK